MYVDIPPTDIPYRFPSSASPGYAIGLTECSNSSFQIGVEMVVVVAPMTAQLRPVVFANVTSAGAFVEVELLESVLTPSVVRPEAPAVALSQEVPLIAALVASVELASVHVVEDTQVVAMAVAAVDIAVVERA